MEMKQEENETMTYAQYKKIMDNDYKGQLRVLSQFLFVQLWVNLDYLFRNSYMSE